MLHRRQAPGRDIHKHFSLAPARSHTTTANSKASATKQTAQQPQPPQHNPRPPKHLRQRADTGGEGQKRGGQQCALPAHTAPPSPPACAPPLADARSSERTQTVKGRRGEGSSTQYAHVPPPSPPACAPPLADARSATLKPHPWNHPARTQALAESPTLARAQMRRYTEFGIRVLMSARVAAMGVHTSVCAGYGKQP